MFRVSSLVVVGASLLCCSSASVTSEWGAGCSDGKDNDGDGLIDCADPDCQGLPACGGRPDGAPKDARADAPRPDRVADRKPAPDQPPASIYGSRCQNPGGLCGDGKTICIPGIGGPAGLGYCTYPCAGGDPYSCPAAPSGLAAACVYQYNYKDYCSFLCRLAGKDYLCPPGMECFDSNPSNPYQKYCWPR